MRSRFILMVFLLWLLSAMASAQVKLPDTPAGKRMAELLAMIESEEGRKIQEWVEAFAPELLNRLSVKQQMAFLEKTHDSFGGFDLINIEMAEPNSLTVIGKGKKSTQVQRLSISTTTSPPYAITDITIEPATPPARKSVAPISNSATSKDVDSAHSLFQTGKFSEAEALCTKVLAKEPRNFSAALLKGHIALISNRLAEAQKWLTQAVELEPQAREPKSLLVEAFYRQGNFQKAAPLLRAVGHEPMAKQLESFRGVIPYQLESKLQSTAIKFVRTDPLPIVSARINDSEEVNLLIDTGGGELIIDSALAERLKVLPFGSATGTYAGGLQAGFQFGRIASVTLGDFKIRNVPVHIKAPPQLPAFGKRIDGIIGTIFLSKFISTLDYPKGELILRAKTKENLKQVERQAASDHSIVIPFWMTGDHEMVAWGSVNKSQPMLLFVDTGLAGGGFIPTESTIKEAGIQLDQRLIEAVGGGGTVKITPFMVDELTLGQAKENNIRGFWSGSSVGKGFGFRLGGLISHQFFRPYSLTMDFTSMRFFLKRKES